MIYRPLLFCIKLNFMITLIALFMSRSCLLCFGFGLRVKLLLIPFADIVVEELSSWRAQTFRESDSIFTAPLLAYLLRFVSIDLYKALRDAKSSR
jgi:hypothetical protein